MNKLGSTTDDDLRNLAHQEQIPGFQVYSINTLPKKLSSTKIMSLIINDDATTSGKGGTHWISMYSNPKDKYVIFFDPVGMAPPPELLRLMKSTNKKVLASTTQVQDVKADSCGWWNIYVLHNLSEGHNLSDILSKLSSNNQKKNEQILQQFFS